jgi:hypothetical protein
LLELLFHNGIVTHFAGKGNHVVESIEYVQLCLGIYVQVIIHSAGGNRWKKEDE